MGNGKDRTHSDKESCSSGSKNVPVDRLFQSSVGSVGAPIEAPAAASATI